MSKLKKLSVLISFLFLLISCSHKLPEIKWAYSDNDVIGEKISKSESIDIDIYLDATTSMEGFALNSSSTYSQFLDQLEASAMSAWKKADPRYFKFGQKIKPISRTDFLLAKNNSQFYKEKGIFLKTYIDSVVKYTDSKRLSVLITDLFQDEGDVNTMVDRIKEKCFSKEIMVGIIGVKSEFNGKVFDVPLYPKGYDLKTKERPFYAFIFGNPYNMELLFEGLKTNQFVKENQFIVFSSNIIKSFETSLTKTKDSKFVNKKAPREVVKNSFDFSMKEEGKDAKFNFEIDLKRNLRCANFFDKNLEVIVYKKSITDSKKYSKDSILTNEITIENLEQKGDKLSGTLVMKNEDGAGNYSYEVLLKANQLNGLQTPPWITEFSTTNPIINDPSASKTYNLEKLVSRLLVANASVKQISIAKFYINIFKR